MSRMPPLCWLLLIGYGLTGMPPSLALWAGAAVFDLCRTDAVGRALGLKG